MTVLLALGLAGPAAARDSAAPANAPGDWLPQEEWVMERWLPYDEARLYAILRITRRDLRRWLANDERRTLGQLAHVRGVPVRGLAERLVEPRRAAVTARVYGALVARARRTLTQGHLSQHVFFHDFHQWAPLRATPRIFGVGDETEWRRLRLRGMTPLEIGRRYGRPKAPIRSQLIAVLEASAERGVALGDTSRRQADAFLAEQRRTADRWLRSPLVRPPVEGSAKTAAAGDPALALCPLWV